MKTRNIVISCVLGLTLFAGLGVAVFERTLAVCNTSDLVGWYYSPPSTTAASNGAFDVNMGLAWAYKSTSNPWIGAVEYDTSSTNIATVDYTPAYFFPSQCVDDVVIEAEGFLDTDCSNGTLKTLGWVVDPYREDTKILTVYEGCP